MDTPMIALTFAEIARRYPDQWVLVEETAWDAQGHPRRGIVHAASRLRAALRAPLQVCHQHPQVKTFIFYTGDPIPAHLTVVL